MNNQDLNFLDAIRMAIQAEAESAAFYEEAARKTKNPLGRRLFEQLSEFERYHESNLSALEESLCKDGTCIIYEGRDLSLPEETDPDRPLDRLRSAPTSAASAETFKEPDKMSAMEIITKAMEVKETAEKRYTALAEQTTDPAGQAMFRRLAEEEHANYRILSDAYWSLNNRGVWTWSRASA